MNILIRNCLFFTIACLGTVTSLNAQKQAAVVSRDTIGIKITEKDFDILVNECLSQLKDTTALKDTTFYINFVRIYNTIVKNYLSDEYKKVIDAFREKVFNDAVRKLDAGFYKGGAMYCYTYNLFIGGPRHHNSQYRIIKD